MRSFQENYGLYQKLGFYEKKNKAVVRGRTMCRKHAILHFLKILVRFG